MPELAHSPKVGSVKNRDSEDFSADRAVGVELFAHWVPAADRDSIAVAGGSGTVAESYVCGRSLVPAGRKRNEHASTVRWIEGWEGRLVL